MDPTDDTSLEIARIEAGLAADRAQVATRIDDLRARLAPDALMEDVKNMAMKNLGPLTHTIDSAVRANPLAAACIGVGVAWLLLGGRRSARTANHTEGPLAGTKFEAMTRWEDEGGPPRDLPEPDETAWIAEADLLRDRAQAALGRITAAARNGLKAPAQAAQDRADVVASFAADARRALRAGLGHLPHASQDAIAAVREGAYVAHRAAIDGAGKLIDDRPLVAGGIALALGAGVASLLPRTEIEQRLFGAERDRLIRVAKAALQDERDRATAIVADLAGTLRETVGKTASHLAHGTG